MTRWPNWLPKEPDAEQPPVRVGRDWVLAAAVLVTTTAEVLLREDLRWPPVVLAVGLILAAAMLWRRTHPLVMVTIAFGSLMVVDVAAMLITGEPFFFAAGAFVLFLVYSLFRWGTSRPHGDRTACHAVALVAERNH